MRNNRKRNIIWSNPPFNNNTPTNIGRVFLNLVKKHFLRQHKFYKIFNKNNDKVNYSCIPNVKSKIDAHNKRILTPTNADIDRTCNCTRNTICPLDNNCLTKNIVYEATISSNLQNYEPKKIILVYVKALLKNGFLGTSHPSTLKDTDTALPCSQKHGELKKMTESPILPGELYPKNKLYPK